MPKYLLQVAYTSEGAKGLLKDGGSKRKASAQKLVEGLGGKIETFYFAFGKDGAVVIADLPDTASAAATSLALAASGAVTGHTTVLITPEEMDQATRKQVTYTPPGR